MGRNLCTGQVFVANAEEALGQRLWLDTWREQHSAEIRPGWSTYCTASIPEVTYEEDDPPRPGGLIARAEVGWTFVFDIPGDAGDMAASQYSAELNARFSAVAVRGLYDFSNLAPGPG